MFKLLIKVMNVVWLTLSSVILATLIIIAINQVGLVYGLLAGLGGCFATYFICYFIDILYQHIFKDGYTTERVKHARRVLHSVVKSYNNRRFKDYASFNDCFFSIVDEFESQGLDRNKLITVVNEKKKGCKLDESK